MIINKAFFTFSVLWLGTIVTATNTNSGCEIPIASKRHYTYQWPLIYKKSTGELYPTTAVGGYEQSELKVMVEPNEEVLLSCGPNYLKNFQRKSELSVRCNGASGNFSVDNREKSIKEFACDLRVIEEVLTPVDGCANDQWTATSFGYVDPTEQLTFILGEACYDMAQGRTIFAHVKLGDKDSNILRKVDKRYLTTRRHPDGRYKIELFRGLHFDEIYERIRTQLHTKNAPHLKMANFIDNSLLSSAQFQAVKKLGWNYFVVHDELDVLVTLKQDIQRLSNSHNLDVFVGSHGVRTLTGLNGDKMKVYLRDGRFPMPDLIWILVKHQQKVSAFGVANEATNSVLTMKTSSPEICKSECEKVSWLLDTLEEHVNREPLICCSYAEFKKTIVEVPQWSDEEVKEMLI